MLISVLADGEDVEAIAPDCPPGVTAENTNCVF